MSRFLTLSESIVMLAIWRLKEEAYGVTIRKQVLETTGRRLSYGTLYSTLDQLVAKGYASKAAGYPTPKRGGRHKIFYSLSPNGRAALREARALHHALWDGIEDIPC